MKIYIEKTLNTDFESAVLKTKEPSLESVENDKLIAIAKKEKGKLKTIISILNKRGFINNHVYI